MSAAPAAASRSPVSATTRAATGAAATASKRVQQRRGGDLCGDPVADGRGEPRLGAAGLRSLRDHQQGHRQDAHEITFQKSRIAVMLPRRNR